MSNLNHIASDVDFVMDKLSNPELYKLQRTIIALRRIQKGFASYFDSFLALIKKIENFDPLYSFYSSFLDFLSQKLHTNNLFYKLELDLSQKGYDEKTILNMKLSYDELAIINRFPKTKKPLYSLIFFLYKPIFSYSFFIEKLLYPIFEDERKLLDTYQNLSLESKEKVFSYAKDLLENESTRKND